MMNGMGRLALAAGLIGVPASHAGAKWTEIPVAASSVAKSPLMVVAPAHWNRWSVRQSKKGESWSFDGPLLNRIDFYAGLAVGEPLQKERDRKRNPLPKVATGMGPTEVSELFEHTSRITENAADFTIDTVAPVTFAGNKGFRFTFHYTGRDDVLVRKGLASGAVIGGKLYLIAYTAPGVHYYDAGLADATAVMDSARL